MKVWSEVKYVIGFPTRNDDEILKFIRLEDLRKSTGANWSQLQFTSEKERNGTPHTYIPTT